jgi:hypothetical protein
VALAFSRVSSARAPSAPEFAGRRRSAQSYRVVAFGEAEGVGAKVQRSFLEGLGSFGVSARGLRFFVNCEARETFQRTCF